MKLKIENFAKISKAEIKIDGITVIAGENNTGKSTVGKILFAMFNALNDIDEKTKEERSKETDEACRLVIREYYRQVEIKRTFHFSFGAITHKISLDIQNAIQDFEKTKNFVGFFRGEELSEIIRETLHNYMDIKNEDKHIENEMVQALMEKVREIFNLPEGIIIVEVVSQLFGDVFNRQINTLTKKTEAAQIGLEIKNKHIDLSFQNDRCQTYLPEIGLMHQAVYIDNPFVTDVLNSYGGLNVMDSFLRRLLEKDIDRDVMDGVIDAVLVRKKLEEINTALEDVIQGKISKKSDGEYYLEKEGFSEPIALVNLSTGLKSFAIIKMLLEKGALKEKDVLILDEPEIHLHPQWQIAYAELIVLLQKAFNLSILVTTHSPYFLDAINLYSIKYGIANKTNYYLSSINDEQCVEMECVTDNLEQIYQKMATPIQALETLRYELENA